MKDALNPNGAMSLQEAYANAVITDALDTDDDEMEESQKSDLNADEDKKDQWTEKASIFWNIKIKTMYFYFDSYFFLKCT